MPESDKNELVGEDGREAGQRNAQRMVMKQRYAEQRQRKQDEFDRYAE
jgi:hypothetical protein